MNQLIDDLLAYSRMERRTLSIEHIVVPRLVQSLVDERQADFAGRLRLKLRLEAERVVADADALAQALRNYLDNAIKFTRQQPAPEIEIGARRLDSCCRFWVRDNGIGFDMKYHDRIFEIFERLHRAEDHPGTGIGLAIVHKAMERLGGRAWAESEPGAGATFYVDVPVREPDDRS
jgi:signal transduction histidine kinase